MRNSTEFSHFQPGALRRLFRYALDKEQDIADFYWFLKTQLYYKQSFDQIGSRSRILRPLRINRPWNMNIGNDVIINSYTWLYTEDNIDGLKSVKLVIGDGCKIGNVNHIAAINGVYLGKKVLTADKVYISDHIHDYQNPTTAIMDQPIISKGKVEIGDGTWIGENVSIICSKIGKNCVIGANSVVTHDIPDFSVAAGIPARVVKRYSESSRVWERVA